MTSGEIRKAIALARRRVNDAAANYEKIRLQLDQAPDALDNDTLYEFFEDSWAIFEKARKATMRLETRSQDWDKLIADLTGEEKEAEVKVRENYIAKYGDFVADLEKGQLAVDHLRRRINGFRIAVAERLELEDLEDDPQSENTLRGTKASEDVFRPTVAQPIVTPTITTNHAASVRDDGLETAREDGFITDLPITPTLTRAASDASVKTAVGPIGPKQTEVETAVVNVQSGPPNQLADLAFLPKVTIPTFSGIPQEWPTFSDTFEAMVGSRNLEGCLKVFYLRSHLKGEALDAISHVGSSNTDYEIAMKTLKEAYGDPTRVAHRIRALLIQYKIAGTTATALYKGYAHLKQLMSQLASVGDNTNNTTTGHIISGKFPEFVTQALLQKYPHQMVGGDIVLDEIGKILQLKATAEHIRQDDHIRDPFQQRKLVLQRAYTHYANDGQGGNNLTKKRKPLECYLCTGDHLTYRCPVFVDAAPRRQQAITNGLCFNCLKPDHVADECSSEHSCKTCGGRHHTSICQGGTSSGTPTLNPPKRVAFSKGSSTATKGTGRANGSKGGKSQRRGGGGKGKGKPIHADTQIAVAEESSGPIVANEAETEKAVSVETTALAVTRARAAQIRSEPQTSLLPMTHAVVMNPHNMERKRTAVLLLDGGSTRSYITDEAAKSLNLPILAGHDLTVRCFGTEKTKTRKSNTYLLSLQTLKDGKQKKWTFEVVGIPTLSGDLPMAIPELLLRKRLPVTLTPPEVLLGIDQGAELMTGWAGDILPSGFRVTHTSIGPFVYGLGRVHLVDGVSGEENTFHTFHTDLEPEGSDTPGSSDAIAASSPRNPAPNEPVVGIGFYELITGPMWAGKTTLLIHKARAAMEKGYTTLVVKPWADTRSPPDQIQSHDGDTIRAVSVHRLADLWRMIPDYQMLLIDEHHMFEDLEQQLPRFLEARKWVITAGLTITEAGLPMPQSYDVMGRADCVYNLRAKCERCGRTTARFIRKHARLPGQGYVGGKELYEPRCAECRNYPPNAIREEITFMAIAEEDCLEDLKDEETDLSAIQFHNSVAGFWALETIGIRDNAQITDDEKALALFRSSVKREADGRFVCSWPYNCTKPDIPSNYQNCLGRLKSTLRRLNKEPGLIERYDAVFKEQVSLGIIEQVERSQRDGRVHYIPHQAVLTPQKTTTKLRVVYDASCKTSNGRCLNDYLLRGPVMLPNLVGMLMRFRQSPIPILADVEKAFLQLTLRLGDRDVTRFLWVKDLTKPPEGDNLIIFRFARVCFGVVSSPFLLAATIDHHLQEVGSPLALQMRANSYVDNILIAAKTVEEAIQAFKESREIFAEAQMNLREFQSAHPGFKEFLEKEGMNVPETVKVLGVKWDTTADTVAIPVAGKVYNSEGLTKRKVLKTLASVYDPLGLRSPATARAKLYVQNLWRTPKGWDDVLTSKETVAWPQIVEDLTMEFPPVPRQLFQETEGPHQLHIFTDASPEAYSAVGFLRRPEGTTSFVMGKARIGPMKPVSVPRMELFGALIGSALGRTVTEELKDAVQISEVFLWTDSMIVLSWIRSNKALPTFVRNRVCTIKGNLPTANFRYVPGIENPADWATKRYATVAAAQQGWTTSPHWLSQPESQWPEQVELDVRVDEEITLLAIADEVEVEALAPVFDFGRFSKWTIAVRTIMRVLTFINNRILNRITDIPEAWQKVKNCYDNPHGHTEQFEMAELVAFRLIQAQAPPTRDLIKQLHLFKEPTHQLWRSQTRLSNSRHDQTTKTPLFLSDKHRGTRLFVLHTHRLLFHAPPGTTLSTVRLSTWIPNSRELVKKVIRHDCNCHEQRPFRLAPFPAYPEARVVQQPPFNATGLDYGGPVTLKVSTNVKTKGYVCLFTCLTTRAVHLELVTDLTPSAFLQALRRFVSRRGAPSRVWSDNATTFRAAAEVVRQLWQGHHEEFEHYIATRGIKWEFITERAPWMGGAWERLIQSTKRALKKAIGHRQPTIMEMHTVLAEIEAVINSRPLIYVPGGENTTVIRPIDAIQPGARLGVPAEDRNDEKDPDFQPGRLSPQDKLIATWRDQLKAVDRFWASWNQDYLTSLHEKPQTSHQQGRSLTEREPKAGEVVHLLDGNALRGQWKLGRVIKVESPRKVTVQVASTKRIVQRPLSALRPLEFNPDLEGVPPPTIPPPKRQKPEKADAPAPRRSARIRARTYFAVLMVALTAAPALAHNDSTTRSCTKEDCSPWAWDCCTPLQKTGLLIWLFGIIAILPTLVCIYQALTLLLKPIITAILRTIRFLWRSVCGRRNRERGGHRTRPRAYAFSTTRRDELRRLLNASAVTITVLAYLALTHACSETTSLSSKGGKCAVNETTGTMSCEDITSTQMALRPVGQQACLQVSSNGDTAVLLSITTNNIKLRCAYKAWYYTRDITLDVESVHRCRGASGSHCFDEECESVRTYDDVDEFSTPVRRAPGHSHCTRSCGCATCNGCFLCEPSCLFWRVYSTPASTHTYAVGSCPTWELTIQAVIGQGNTSHEVELRPGQPTKVGTATITLMAATTLQLPVLNKQFIYDETTGQAAVVDAAAPGQPTPGSLGTFQCSSKEAADSFKCSFPESICSCTASHYTATCQCNLKNPSSLISQPDSRIPFTSGPLSIKTNGRAYEASLQQQAGLVIQADVQTANVTVLSYAARCEVQVERKLEGCRSCHEGAEAQIRCQAKNEVIVEIDCGEGNTYSLPCANDSRTITISSTQAHYRSTCRYRCSRTEGSFLLEADLEEITIPPLNLANVGHAWARQASEVPVDSIMRKIIGWGNALGDVVTDVIQTMGGFLFDHPLLTAMLVTMACALLLLLYGVLSTYLAPYTRAWGRIRRRFWPPTAPRRARSVATRVTKSPQVRKSHVH